MNSKPPRNHSQFKSAPCHFDPLGGSVGAPGRKREWRSLFSFLFLHSYIRHYTITSVCGSRCGCYAGTLRGLNVSHLKTLLMPNTVFISRPYFQSPKPIFTVPSGFCVSFVKSGASFIIFIALYLGIQSSSQCFHFSFWLQ